MQKQRPWIELQKILQRDGMTQTQLSKATGLSTGYISDMYRGAVQPSGRAICLIADALYLPKSMIIPRVGVES